MYQDAVELLRDPQTQVVTLHGLGPSPQATGRVIWNPASGGHVFVANLPPAPAGKAYELWTIGDAAPAARGPLPGRRLRARLAPRGGGRRTASP